MNKLRDLLSEGKFGPGSKVPIKAKNKVWNISLGAIENKRRPEAVYIIMSVWVKPKLSISKATALSNVDQNSVALDAAKELESNLKRLQPQLKGFFDTLYFDPDSIIFTYDFAASRAVVGKPQFLEIEINIDTVNDIDFNEEPAPNRKTGKVEYLHFDQFKKPVIDAVNRILTMPVFDRSATVEFQKTKRK